MRDVRGIAQRPLFHFELDFRETIERLHQMMNTFNSAIQSGCPQQLQINYKISLILLLFERLAAQSCC